MSIKLNAELFQEKLARFTALCDSNSTYVFVLGAVTQEDNAQPLTSQFHLWLLTYEFSETIISIKNNEVYFLTSKRKLALIQNMNLPNVKVTERDASTQAEAQTKNFQAYLKNIDLTNAASFPEKVLGDWANSFLKLLPKMNDCTELFKQVTLRKTASEIAAIRVSAKFTEYCTRQMIDHVESLID